MSQTSAGPHASSEASAADESASAEISPGRIAGSEDVVQRVKGGLEYTEDTPTMLWAYDDKPFPGNQPAYHRFQVGISPMTERLWIGLPVGVVRYSGTTYEIPIDTSAALGAA